MTVKLAEILEKLRGGIGQTVQNCSLLSIWGEVVDERVGKQTEAVKVVNKVLYVSAASPAWAQELSYLKVQIIEKFNQKAGREIIRDIRFRTGG